MSLKLPGLAPRCPACQRTLDGACAADDEAEAMPKPDDVTVCAYCSLVLVFTPALQLRSMTPDEFDELEPETRAVLRRTQAVIQYANLHRVEVDR
jgi:hypothetical protein